MDFSSVDEWARAHPAGPRSIPTPAERFTFAVVGLAVLRSEVPAGQEEKLRSGLDEIRHALQYEHTSDSEFASFLGDELDHVGGEALAPFTEPVVQWTDDGPRVFGLDAVTAYSTAYEPSHEFALSPDEVEHVLAIADEVGPPRLNQSNSPSVSKRLGRCQGPLEDEWLRKRLGAIIGAANGTWWRLDLASLAAQVVTYPAGASHPAHVDNVPGNAPWKLSVSIQLSEPDTYEGGDLRLYHRPNADVAPRALGSVIVYPAWTRHEVRPVTSGVRRALVAWATGPAFR